MRRNDIRCTARTLAPRLDAQATWSATSVQQAYLSFHSYVPACLLHDFFSFPLISILWDILILVLIGEEAADPHPISCATHSRTASAAAKMGTGQLPPAAAGISTSLKSQQALGPSPASISHPPGFPLSLARPSMFGAFPESQVPADTQSFPPRPVRVYSPQEIPATIKASRSSVEYGLYQLRSLQQRRYRPDEVGVEERLRVQAASVLGDLGALRREVADVIREAERHRIRKWWLGGM